MKTSHILTTGFASILICISACAFTILPETSCCKKPSKTKPVPSAEEYPIGVSLSLFGHTMTQEEVNSVRAAGIKYVEVVMTPYMRKLPESEFVPAMTKVRDMLANARLEVWSVHLPYGKKIDISVLDNDLRAQYIQKQKEMIALAGELFHPKRLILHPSAEPITDEERQQRLIVCKQAIAELIPEAKKIGAVICVEDLPRTCLGNTSEEILYLIKDYPEVMCCFDSNHLLKEEHSHFFENVGSRIATIHASDYDRVDERHWIEGTPGGVIDWPAFYKGLKDCGYEGVFMHECRNGENVNPATIKEAYEKVVLCKN